VGREEFQMKRLPTAPLSFFMVCAFFLLPALHQTANAVAGQISASDKEVDQILDKYIQVMGGRLALEGLTTRRMKGRVSQAAARVAGQVQIDQKAPNKWLEKEVFIYTAPPPNDHSERQMGFNGTIGWSGSDDMAAGTLAERNLAFDLGRPLRLRVIYRSLKLTGTQQVESDHSRQQYRAGAGEREDLQAALERAASGAGPSIQAYVIEAIGTHGNVDKLYFDAKSGLLLRCDLGVPAGQNGLTWLFEDYRDVGGLKVPYRLVYRQNFSGTQVDTIFQFGEVYHNISIDDVEFERPKAKF
jgi:hypothetical protein